MIIVQLIGGIGNQMFQYACGRHLAILNNTELKLDLSFLQNRVPFRKSFVFRNYDLDIFNLEAHVATCSDIPLYPPNWKIDSISHRLYHLLKVRLRGYKYFLERRLNSYNLMLFNKHVLLKRGNIYLAGYWASPLYFEDIRDIVRREFTFKKELPPHAYNLKERIVSGTSICINVRRKEFLTVKAMGFHGADYINRAIDILSERVAEPVFYIFSDDLEWCRENINLRFPSFFVGEEYYGEKYGDYLHLMTLCKHFIISNSTFAWWAAWLGSENDKMVFVPKKLFNAYNDVDYIPSDWIRI